ncbi:pirin family protein [Martelella soudanensis]|uniref:pirin family protein n=1 Tax=unclassified Martelella TaxID=2629616 RepID=UPI0015DDEA55|nr:MULTISPECIES: pirin family protein [unclassified Martelella]
MSFFPGKDPEFGDAASCNDVTQLIIPRTSDIGGFEVRRALPTIKRRLVGPFIFFDRMGPARFGGHGEALDVKPHPHIGLSTVTYLTSGEIGHRDTLGNHTVIRPGDVNLMTAGRGIVHSERTPDDLRLRPHALSGVQTWLALPEHDEEIDPSFGHTEKNALPTISDTGVSGRLVLGHFCGMKADVKTFTDTLLADIALRPGARLSFPAEHEERAIYILEGQLSVAGDVFDAEQLLVLAPNDPITIGGAGEHGCRLMFFGGEALEKPRHIWWNFVSSSKERIEQAKEDWRQGRFGLVPGDEQEFVPLPER